MIKAIGAALAAVSLLALAAIALGYTGAGYGVDVPVQGPERLSPADRVSWEQILVDRSGVRINGLLNARLVSLADTNSMDPALDEEATVIEVVPESADELHAGDIISYMDGSNAVIHRIVEIGNDGEWYAVTKGDNNAVADPAKVRFGQVKGVVVGIIY
ncbi:MAG: hypothetical protein QW548_02410 [Candidatus Aenigmatarchaeota archaeon]